MSFSRITLILFMYVSEIMCAILPEAGLVLSKQSDIHSLQLDIHAGPSFLLSLRKSTGYMDIGGPYLILTPSFILCDILSNPEIGLSFKAEYDLNLFGFMTSIHAIKLRNEHGIKFINSYGLGPVLIFLANLFIGVNVCHEEKLYTTFFINVNIRPITLLSAFWK